MKFAENSAKEAFLHVYFFNSTCISLSWEQEIWKCSFTLQDTGKHLPEKNNKPLSNEIDTFEKNQFQNL